ncbi:MAG: Dam family site-specific DNA-(adenine-N6)-methyltransferase [Pseudomonadota bacterium]|mgnify:CR=1 FL=1
MRYESTVQRELFDFEQQPPKTNLLRWAGSKASVVSQISKYIDFTRDYLEPFCGSAALHFEGLPSRAFLNDANSKLISFYSELASKPLEVWTWYDEQPVDEPTYYAIRDEYNLGRSATLEAAMFLYLNHFGWNGIYRTNNRGMYNTPFGASSKPKRKVSFDELQWYAERIPRNGLFSLDFEEMVRQIDPVNACIFFDPPYYTGETRVFNEYGEVTFQSKDLVRLHALACEFAEKNSVIITYKDCEEFRNLFEDHIIEANQVSRIVGGKAERRKSELELVAKLGS